MSLWAVNILRYVSSPSFETPLCFDTHGLSIYALFSQLLMCNSISAFNSLMPYTSLFNNTGLIYSPVIIVEPPEISNPLLSRDFMVIELPLIVGPTMVYNAARVRTTNTVTPHLRLKSPLDITPQDTLKTSIRGHT